LLNVTSKKLEFSNVVAPVMSTLIDGPLPVIWDSCAPLGLTSPTVVGTVRPVIAISC
jgi:hypothetical protein